MPPKTREQRLFGAACLKLTLEKNVNAEAEDIEIYQQSLGDLDLTAEDVQTYLVDNRAIVQAALDKRGQPVH